MDEYSDDDIPKEPQVTSMDPQERILARRLRLQRKLDASEGKLAKKEVKPTSALFAYDQEEKWVPSQIESSMSKLLQLQDDGLEIVTNVQVASVQHEVQRQEDARKNRMKRLQIIEVESEKAVEDYKNITAKWKEIDALNDPLDIHEQTELQREKCLELIANKDALIERLRNELKVLDERFTRDLEKQEEDLSLLVDRIDEQVKIMRKAYRTELDLLENAIETEREEILKVQGAEWDRLVRKNERIESSGPIKRYALLEEHNQALDEMLIKQQEFFRSRKLELFNTYQNLEMEREKMKSLFMLNTEKLNYNYDLLQKRDEENQSIKSQQKRMITKLQDTLTNLRSKVTANETKMSKQIQKLSTEISNLHKDIELTEQKADHFAFGNCEKYLQMWDFNQKRADELIKQLLNADKVFYEQQLGLDWTPPERFSFNKEHMPSFKEALKLVSETMKPPQRQKPYYTKPLEKKSDLVQTNILKAILEKIADNTGFLTEGKLRALMEPFSSKEKTLVSLDNIFAALGLHEVNDMKMLANYFYPYAECEMCMNEEEKSEAEVTKLWADYETEKVGHPRDTTCNIATLDSKVNEERDVLDKVKTVVHKRLEVMDSVIRSELQNETNAKQSEEFEKSELLSASPKSDACNVPTMDEKADSYSSVCSNPKHKPSIDPIYILKVLREFLQDHCADQAMKEEEPLEKLMTKKRTTVSRLVSEQDVRDYWEKYRSVMTKEKEEVWDTLLNGLKSYLSCLKERHHLNEEIKKLKKVNTDVRLLLQNYIAEPYRSKAKKELTTYFPNDEEH